MIDDTSRFGRNLSDTLPLTDQLEYAKVFLYFVNRDLHSGDRNFRTLFITYQQQDEEYTKGMGQKVHRGQRGRVLNGYVGSGRTYGYINVPVPSLDAKWRHGRAARDGVRLEVNQEEKAVVIRVFEMYASGLGPRAIARQFNLEGIPRPTRRNGRSQNPWGSDGIWRMVHNTKYRGVNTWNKSHVVLNPNTKQKEQHPRPESEWERVENEDLSDVKLSFRSATN